MGSGWVLRAVCPSDPSLYLATGGRLGRRCFHVKTTVPSRLTIQGRRPSTASTENPMKIVIIGAKPVLLCFLTTVEYNLPLQVMKGRRKTEQRVNAVRATYAGTRPGYYCRSSSSSIAPQGCRGFSSSTIRRSSASSRLDRELPHTIQGGRYSIHKAGEIRQPNPDLVHVHNLVSTPMFASVVDSRG